MAQSVSGGAKLTLLAGDFNATPDSDELRFLRGLHTLGRKARTTKTHSFAQPMNRKDRATPGRDGILHTQRLRFCKTIAGSTTFCKSRRVGTDAAPLRTAASSLDRAGIQMASILAITSACAPKFLSPCPTKRADWGAGSTS